MTIAFIMGAWLFAFLAAFKVYHELRIKRIQEVYDSIPEARRGKVFRDLYLLHQEGEFLKDAGAERRQKWDEEVIIFLGKHFSDICKNNYFMATDRGYTPSLINPINDDKFNSAVLILKHLLERDFLLYYKG